jgi:UDP-2-acetamido-3-amino-2,3-dideoxy-glucuronate N-acetyltransferase
VQNYIHPDAYCESSQIGSGTRIWKFARVMADVVIGENCNICDFVFIENGVKIGNNVTIKCGVFLWTGILIEDDVFVGPNATFANDKFPRSGNREKVPLRTYLRKGCSIGANATILPNIEIGAGSMVGAGAVVTKNVNPNSVVFGNPASERE